MAVLDRISRPLLAGIFIAGGVRTLLHPERPATQGTPVVDAARKVVPGLPDDAVLLARVNAASQIAAAGLMVAGVAPRVAAAYLAATLIPTTLAGHRFWEQSDPAMRQQQLTHALKNLAILGGLIEAARPRPPRAARRSAQPA